MSLPIEMRFNGQTLATGTSFVATTEAGPFLITNRHNVTGRHQETGQPLSPTGGVPNELRVIQNRKGQLGQWVPRIEPLYADENPLWFEHPQFGSKADFVALRLTQLDDVELYPYDPASPGVDARVSCASTVSVVGFPFGMTGGGALAIWATGFVASEPDIDFASLPTFLIDCRSRQGQSGSAVIIYSEGGTVPMRDGSTAMFSGPVWRLLGIYSGRINSESDLGIVWRAEAISQLLKSIK
jgi:hypothetical protein